MPAAVLDADRYNPGTFRSRMTTLKVHSPLQAFGMLAAVSSPPPAPAISRGILMRINTAVSYSFIGRMHRRLAVLFLNHNRVWL
jgi:hypothetical protein